MAEKATRRQLGRWLGWFGLANTAVLGLIALQYLSHYQGAESAIAWVYLVAIYVSHHALLAFLPLTAVLGPLIVIAPRPGWVFAAGALLMAALIAIMQLDTLLWSQSHFHINLLTAKILGWQSWLFVGVMFLIGLFFETVMARAIWRWVSGAARRGGGRAAAFVALCLVAAQGIHAWADAAYYTPVTGLGQQLPVHSGVTAKKLMVRTGLVDIQQSRERQLARRMAGGLAEAGTDALDYPLEPLRCENQDPINILIVMLDSWRFDLADEEHTPSIDRWASERATVFENHYSGGNSSRMGVFSFFYGLPPGYFDSFEGLQRPALLISEAQRQGYQMGLFTSADMYRPVTLDRTAFASVPGLRVTPENPQDPAWKRDADMTLEWISWLDATDLERPFFGFLFYDTPNAVDPPESHRSGFESPDGHPMPDRLRRYRQGIHYADALVGEVLADLEARGLADRTVVLVTSDHGEEFQESGPEFSIHGSGYSRWQLGVPLFIAWPGMAPGEITTRTSHYDVAPTLLKRLMGCDNAPDTFSVGQDLFTRSDWPWLIAGSYYNYAVVEPDQVTVTYPNGAYEVRDADYRISSDPQLRAEVIQGAMEQNRRFHR